MVGDGEVHQVNWSAGRVTMKAENVKINPKHVENCLEKGDFVRNNVFVWIIIWWVVQGDARWIDGAGQDIVYIHLLELNYMGLHLHSIWIKWNE